MILNLYKVTLHMWGQYDASYVVAPDAGTAVRIVQDSLKEQGIGTEDSRSMKSVEQLASTHRHTINEKQGLLYFDKYAVRDVLQESSS